MNSDLQGLYKKYIVYRTDGRDGPGQDKCNAEYFVLDLMNDKYALEALDTYVRACEEKHPQLAKDLRSRYLDKS